MTGSEHDPLIDRDTNESGFPGTAFSRRTLLHGAAWAAPVVAMAVSASPALAASKGCHPDGTLFDSISRGKLLGGSLLGNNNLDNLVDLNGVVARAIRGTSTAVEDTQANPLNLGALNLLELELGGVAGVLSDVLNFIAPADLGALNEYAWAHQSGDVIGASGAVSDNGALDLSGQGPSAPALASLDLKRIVENLLGSGAADLIGEIADLKLELGALAGRVEFSSLCFPPTNLLREYLLAYLRVRLESNLVGGVVTTLQEALDAVLGSDGLLNQVLGLITDVLTMIPGVDATASITVDTSSLTTEPIPGGAGHALQVHLGEGTAVIDLGAIAGYANASDGSLNGLPPNTRLLSDTGIPGDRILAAIDPIVDHLLESLQDLITINLVITQTTFGITSNVLRITGSLRDFIEGTATVEVLLLGPILNPILGTVVLPLLASIGSTVLAAVRELLRPGDGTLSTVFAGLNAVLSVVGRILHEVVHITINAQNNVDGWKPQDMEALTHPNSGRYDVAALHIGAANLGQLNLLDVFLGRGSGGENHPRSLPQVIFPDTP